MLNLPTKKKIYFEIVSIKNRHRHRHAEEFFVVNLFDLRLQNRQMKQAMFPYIKT